MRRALIVITTMVVAVAATAVSAVAAPGSLDTTFGSSGLTITNIPGVSDEQANDMVLDSQNRVVVVGQAGNKFLVARYSADGALDTSFDSDGYNTVTVAGANNYATSVAVQPDGKIVVAGFAQAATEEFGVARFNSDGSLDSSFGGDGLVEVDISAGGGGELANAIELQSDGKIVLAGYAPGLDFGVARLNSDGSLDTSFGGDGTVSTELDAGGNDQAVDLVTQTDGKIVLVGKVDSGNQLALVRYNSDGSLDSSFDGDGKVVTTPGGFQASSVGGMALTSSGKLVVVGSTSSGGGERSILLAQFSSSGALDTAFGVGGVTVSNFTAGDDVGSGVTIDPDGRIVVAGRVNETGASTAESAVARYDSNGSADSTFGTAGLFRKDIFSADDSAVVARRQSSNGKYVVAGVGEDVDGPKLTLLRLDGDTADLSVSGSFDRSSYTTGDTAQLTLKVSNSGPQAAASVTLREQIPSGSALVSTTPSQGSCSGSTTVECSLGSIPAGSSATVVLGLKADTAGTNSDSASVQTVTYESDTQNNSATTALVVNAPPVVDSSDKTKPKVTLRILTKKLSVVARSRKLGVRIGSDEAVSGVLRIKIAGSGKTRIKKTITLTKKGTKSFTLKVSRSTYRALKRKAKVGGKRRPYAKIQATLEVKDRAGNAVTKKATGKLRRARAKR